MIANHTDTKNKNNTENTQKNEQKNEIEKTPQQQRAEVHSNIWQMANEVRGKIDGWDFKQYVLGTLFYRFISENFCAYMNGSNPENDYAAMKDDDPKLSEALKQDCVEVKGFFIRPSHLFQNIAKNDEAKKRLNEVLPEVFQAIENSAANHDSTYDITGLFDDFDVKSSRLAKETIEINKRLASVLTKVSELELNLKTFEAAGIDIFGDAYEFLISNYAANAGKSGGEFFTPQSVSKLLTKLAISGKDLEHIHKIYDPACGSGSLLLQAKKVLSEKYRTENTQQQLKIHELEFYGQEVNHTTFNLARMNMFLHNINYDKFEIALGDTLIAPSERLHRCQPFDVIVSNPPYSVKWDVKQHPELERNPRFEVTALAPQSKADFAFVLDVLYNLAEHGRAAMVCFPGIFYRGGAEETIRKYLIEQNFVEAVIALPPNLFFGTSIAVNILVLAKNKNGNTKTRFIDASELFKKETNTNILSDENIDQIVAYFQSSEDIPHFARSVDKTDIAANAYNLAVSSYVEAKDTREKIDINTLNQEIDDAVQNINQLRTNINQIISEIHGKNT